MKKNFVILLSICTLLPACRKAQQETCERIRFTAEGIETRVQTKAGAEVTELSSFKIMAKNDMNGRTAFNTTATKSGSYYLTDQIWPQSDEHYTFYASNMEIRLDSEGNPYVHSGGSTETLAAVLPHTAGSYKATNKLQFKHICARVGNVKVNPQAGCSISNVKIIIKNASHEGTYRLDNDSWVEKSANHDTDITKPNGEGDNNIYLTPGTYNFEVKYTLTKGSTSINLTRSANNVELKGGYINNITMTAVGAENIQLSVSIEPWVTSSITPILE